MVQPQPLGVIDSEAAAWATRIDAGPLNPAEQRRLDAWLEADRRHRGAYARARAVLRAVERLPAPAMEPARRDRAPTLNRRAWLAGGGAALAASVVGGLMVADRRGGVDLATDAGEIRRLALADGTAAQLDSQSRFHATVRDDRRRLELKGGEAWLSIAPAPATPFVLAAGPLRASAASAAELVLRLRDGQARLTLVKGTARVWSADAGAQAARLLDAGSEAVLPLAGGALRTARVSEALLTRRLGWREAMLILDGETLAEAAREFNHYNAHRIEVSGAPANIRVVGAFSNTDPQAFVQTMQSLFDVTVSRSPGVTRIS
ncbi:FecR family protein [Brevundimonas diminuta]|uniref:FecR family protein n=1 Tax=Brevundimonas diminuta TaxID=293 RepID=UPI00069B54A1|nr:FecR domain-containing protein [Brevundimonas diminuta]